MSLPPAGCRAWPREWPRLRYVRTSDESKALNDSQQTCVIIAASGMCEAGRVLHHLKHHIGDPRATVLFVGYQAENTLGRRILDGNEVIRIFGDEYEVRAQIKRIGGYSGHADHNDLVGFAHNMVSKPARFRLRGRSAPHQSLTHWAAQPSTIL